jgi:hypothetical protein
MITRDAALSPTPSNTPEIYLSKLDDSDNNGLDDHHDRNLVMTPITAVKYTYSLALLAFSIILIVSVIFNQGTKLSTVNPWLALCVMVGTIVWLGMMEGQQGALVGLTGVVDHLVYKESHSLAFRNTQLAYRGDNLDR